ncbi:MAG: ATP-binding protein [Cyanobacteria bacterium P01_F01_bin.33]
MPDIASLNENDFGEELARVVFPSEAVTDEQLLRGRSAELAGIRQASHQQGRQVFIHGLTGVGKTSLALTAAYNLQSSSKEPIYLSCDEDSDIYSIVQTICEVCSGQKPNFLSSNTTKQVNIAQIFTGSKSSSKERINQPKSIVQCIRLLQWAVPQYSQFTSIVIDEVNKLDSCSKSQLAILIRNLSHANLQAKFIFAGIGESLDDLLNMDRQTYRFLHSVSLQQLGFSALREIIENATNHFDLDVDETTVWRICRISDGFPNFVHLLTEKTLWKVFGTLHEKSFMTRHQFGPSHFVEGVIDAVESVEQELKRDYDAAVKRNDVNTHIILASVADDHELERQISQIYESYSRICSENDKLNTLNKNQFNSRIYNLCKSEYGSILKKGLNRGYYTFSKQRMRGYARLRAQHASIELFPDHPLANQTSAIDNISGFS